MFLLRNSQLEKKSGLCCFCQKYDNVINFCTYMGKKINTHVAWILPPKRYHANIRESKKIEQNCGSCSLWCVRYVNACWFDSRWSYFEIDWLIASLHWLRVALCTCIAVCLLCSFILLCTDLPASPIYTLPHMQGFL